MVGIAADCRAARSPPGRQHRIRYHTLILSRTGHRRHMQKAGDGRTAGGTIKTPSLPHRAIAWRAERGLFKRKARFDKACARRSSLLSDEDRRQCCTAQPVSTAELPDLLPHRLFVYTIALGSHLT